MLARAGADRPRRDAAQRGRRQAALGLIEGRRRLLAALTGRAGPGEQFLMGNARFVGPHDLDDDGQRARSSAVDVATGSRPILQDSLPGLGDRLRTTDGLCDLPRLPRNLGTLDIEAIVVELGLAFSRLGVAVYAGDLRDNLAGIAGPAVAARPSKASAASARCGWDGRWVSRPHPMAYRCTLVKIAPRLDELLAAFGPAPEHERIGPR